jgi:hypothetical protein
MSSKFNETKEYQLVSDSDFCCRVKCYIEKQGLGTQKDYTIVNVGNCFYITEWGLSCAKPSLKDLQFITREDLDSWNSKQPIEPDYRQVYYNKTTDKLVWLDKNGAEHLLE